MATLFNQSTTTLAQAEGQIADAAGASADTEMLARALLSYKASLNHFSNFSNWEWMLVEAPTILVTAPFSVTGVTASANNTFLETPTTAHGVLVGDFIQGQMFAGLAAGRVTSVSAGATTGRIAFVETFNASLIPTASAIYSVTANRDQYDVPTDWKQMYSVRLLNSQVALRPINRRLYDRSITSEFTPTGTPIYYDIFNIGGKGKIRLLRAPGNTDRLQLRYYRRMDPAADPIDVPAQYEPYLLAWAKWHLLMDKADSMDRANGWLQFASNGLQQMLKESLRQPDDDLAFSPGFYSNQVSLGPNSVRQYLDEY